MANDYKNRLMLDNNARLTFQSDTWSVDAFQTVSQAVFWKLLIWLPIDHILYKLNQPILTLVALTDIQIALSR